MDSCADAVAKLSSFVIEDNKQVQMSLKARYLAIDFPNWLSIIERRLQGHPDQKWIASTTNLTIADFCLGGFLCSVHANEENSNYFTFSLIIGKYPRVHTYIIDFQSEVTNHLAARPARPM